MPLSQSLSIKRGPGLHWTKLESISQRLHAFCQPSLVQIGAVVLQKMVKMLNVNYNDDDRHLNPRLRWTINIINSTVQFSQYLIKTVNSAKGNTFWFSRINQQKNSFSVMFISYIGLKITFRLMTDQVWCTALLMYIIVLNRWHGSCWLWCLHPIPTVAYV